MLTFKAVQTPPPTPSQYIINLKFMHGDADYYAEEHQTVADYEGSHTDIERILRYLSTFTDNGTRDNWYREPSPEELASFNRAFDLDDCEFDDFICDWVPLDGPSQGSFKAKVVNMTCLYVDSKGTKYQVTVTG